MMNVSLRGLALLAGALHQLGIRFYVVGGIASSTHGQTRFTEDVDLVMELRPDQVLPLKAVLGPDFEVDEVTLLEAATHNRSDNLFYLPDFTRFDVYLPAPSAFVRSQLERRQILELAEGVDIPIATAEDTLLAKLLWYRRGEEHSQKQWQDVLGIIRLRGAELDRSYLDVWAANLDVTDLLARAFDAPG